MYFAFYYGYLQICERKVCLGFSPETHSQAFTRPNSSAITGVNRADLQNNLVRQIVE